MLRTALLKRRIKEIMNSKNAFQEAETLSTWGETEVQSCWSFPCKTTTGACEQVCKEALNLIQSKLEASLRKPLGLKKDWKKAKTLGQKFNEVFLLAINCWRLAVYSAELLLHICSTVLRIIMGIFWQSWGLGCWPGCPCTALLRLKYEVLTGRQWSLNSSVSLKMLNFLLCVSKMRYRERLRFLRASFLGKGRYTCISVSPGVIGLDCVPLPVVESRKMFLDPDVLHGVLLQVGVTLKLSDKRNGLFGIGFQYWIWKEIAAATLSYWVWQVL